MIEILSQGNSREDENKIDDLIEETKKWAERNRRIKTGDPNAIAELEAEKKALHEKLWKGVEEAKTGEEKTPEKIEEARQEVGKLYNKEKGEESLDKTEQEMASEANFVESKKIIAQQEYEKVKKKMVKWREKYPTQKTPEELQGEDDKLKRKFGIE